MFLNFGLFKILLYLGKDLNFIKNGLGARVYHTRMGYLPDTVFNSLIGFLASELGFYSI